jgi:hypothetical protein
MSNNRINHRGGGGGSSSTNISPYSSSYGTKDQRADEVNRTMLEQENDQRWMELGEQVSLLKSVTIASTWLLTHDVSISSCFA